MTEGARKRVGFSAIGGRRAKAEKIIAILTAAGRSLKPADELLDLGCGSGEIAEHLATCSRVTCSDRLDQRTHGLDLPFLRGGDLLPFPDASFDAVVSNHVIEHTGDPALHLQEIHRVLRPRGVVYLATPNRTWPWEFHARLPLLHYLPRRLFARLGMALGRLHEPVWLLSQQGLCALTQQHFNEEVWQHRILRETDRYALQIPRPARVLLHAMPDSVLRMSAPLQPTLILLLSPK